MEIERDVNGVLLNHTQFFLVSIVWMDSYGITDKWEHIEDLDPMPPGVCYSVGYVLEQTEDYITIAQSVSKLQVLGRLTVPKCAIISKVTLGYPEVKVKDED